MGRMLGSAAAARRRRNRWPAAARCRAAFPGAGGCRRAGMPPNFPGAPGGLPGLPGGKSPGLPGLPGFGNARSRTSCQKGRTKCLLRHPPRPRRRQEAARTIRIVVADSHSPRDGRFIERSAPTIRCCRRTRPSGSRSNCETDAGVDEQGRAAHRPRRALPRRCRHRQAGEAQQSGKGDPAQGTQGQGGRSRQGQGRRRRRRQDRRDREGGDRQGRRPEKPAEAPAAS